MHSTWLHLVAIDVHVTDTAYLAVHALYVGVDVGVDGVLNVVDVVDVQPLAALDVDLGPSHSVRLVALLAAGEIVHHLRRDTGEGNGRGEWTRGMGGGG